MRRFGGSLVVLFFLNASKALILLGLSIEWLHRRDCSIENGNFSQNVAKQGNTHIPGSGNCSLISKSEQSDSKIETLSAVKTDVNDVNNYTMYCSVKIRRSFVLLFPNRSFSIWGLKLGNKSKPVSFIV